MELDPMILWLIAGVVFMVVEMAVITGVGFLFAGLGAITVGGTLSFSLIPSDNTLLQLVLFLAATALWSVALWKPLQKMRMGKNKKSYNNIVGETAIVGDAGLNRITGGEVKWSGTIMKARLAEHAGVDNLAAGSQVIVKEINGNTLTVTPKI